MNYLHKSVYLDYGSNIYCPKLLTHADMLKINHWSRIKAAILKTILSTEFSSMKIPIFHLIFSDVCSEGSNWQTVDISFTEYFLRFDFFVACCILLQTEQSVLSLLIYLNMTKSDGNRPARAHVGHIYTGTQRSIRIVVEAMSTTNFHTDRQLINAVKWSSTCNP